MEYRFSVHRMKNALTQKYINDGKWSCYACPRDAGASALHEASKGGQAGVVSLLLERGANPHAVGTGGVFEDKSPLQASRGLCRLRLI